MLSNYQFCCFVVTVFVFLLPFLFSALGKYEIRERTSVIQLFRIDNLPTRLFKVFNRVKGKNNN